MTAPFSFPTINPGQPIMEPGMGAQVADSLAGVLAAQQQQQEQQFRMQQLAQQQQQQQALAQYYQGTLDVQNREQTRLEGVQSRLDQSSAQSLAGAKQRGTALDAYLGVPQPGMQPPGMQQQPQQQSMQPGNGTQDPTAGLFKPILSGAQQSLAPAQGNPDVFGTSETAGKLASALQGVAPENVEGAIGAIQATQPKPEELPTSAKEFQYAVGTLNKMDPSGKLSQFYIKNWINKGPQTVVNNIPGKVETEYGVKGADADIATRTEALKAADGAVAAFPSLNEGYRMLQKGPVITGLGSGARLQFNRVLGAMGFKPSKEAVDNTQVASRDFYEGVAAQLQAKTFGSGTAISENDRKAAEGMAGVDFSKNLGALKKIARINVGLGVEKLIGATMLLDQQAEMHPEAARTLAIQKRGYEAKLYGAGHTKENATPNSVWGKYQEMVANEAADEAKVRMSVQGVGNQIFGGP